MQSSIRIDKNVTIEVRDGTKLRADIYRPDDNQKHPAIFIRTPYNKLRAAGSIGYIDVLPAADSGYVVIIQDVRGRFASEGEFRRRDLSTVEGIDGYDSVEWIANQPWCDGNVGTAGGSYLAQLQWQTAMENPPHLKAMAPMISGASTKQDQTMLAGTLNLYRLASWVPQQGLDILNKMEKQGKDVSQMRRILLQALANPEETYNFLPLKDSPLAQFESMGENMWKEAFENANRQTLQPYMDYWLYEKVAVPCYHMDGWYDHHLWATFQNFKNMQEKGGSQRARTGQHVLIGPWLHGLPDSVVGQLNFGTSASGPAALSDYTIAFFNKYLRGMDVKLPIIRYFVMGRNMWQNSDTWPPPHTRMQRFFLHSKGHANTLNGDGLLSREQPQSEPPDVFIYNPHFPVPTTGGRLVNQTGMVGGPIDQSHIEKCQDILCYKTPELKEDTEVTGPLDFHLFASTSVKDTDFTAKLIDFYPDGRAFNIAEGIIRARYRKSVFSPEFVNPGEIYEYTINMGSTSNVFKKGHRIGIDISSSNFPASDRNMNTGNRLGEDTQGISAIQNIFHQSQYASYIDLPLA
ncbi:MAG TPA: CocE/NonD family hydrolase [Dehalococcoidales bacterium]